MFRQCQPIRLPLLQKFGVVEGGDLPLPLLVYQFPQQSVHPHTGDLLVKTQHVLHSLAVQSQYLLSLVLFVQFREAQSMQVEPEEILRAVASSEEGQGVAVAVEIALLPGEELALSAEVGSLVF
jgi:hypothetical protein